METSSVQAISIYQTMMQYGKVPMMYFFHLIQKVFGNATPSSSSKCKKTFFKVLWSSKYILEVWLSVSKVRKETISMQKTPLKG